MKKILLLIVFVVFSFSGDVYVKIKSLRANLRVDASKKSQVVVTAKKGDVFKFIKKKGDWIGVQMFSPRIRYIRRKQVKVASYSADFNSFNVSFSNNTGKIKNKIAKIVNKSSRLADKEFPKNPFMKENLRLRLFDSYMLQLFHRNKIQAPVYRHFKRAAIKK